MLDIHKQGSKFSSSVSLWWIQHAFIVSFSFIFLSSVPFFVVYAYNVLCTIRRVLARTKWRIYNAVGQAVMTGGAFRKRERAEFMERSKRKEKNKREQQKWILRALEYGRSSVQNMILTLFLPISMVCLSYFPFGIDSMMASDFPAFFRSLVRNFEFAEQLSKKKQNKKKFRCIFMNFKLSSCIFRLQFVYCRILFVDVMGWDAQMPFSSFEYCCFS